MKSGLISLMSVGSAQWVHRGLHDVPAEFLTFPIPETGLNVTGNVFNWLEEQNNNNSPQHTRGPSMGGAPAFGGSRNQSSMLTQRNGGGLATRFQINLPLLADYGCWCYRGTNYPGGKGPPVDDFDNACKHVHMAWDCMALDAVTAGETCDPSETTYTWMLQPTIYGTVTFECSPSDTWCGQRVCEIDLWFVGEYWNLVYNAIFPQFETYQHGEDDNSYTFDPSTGCPPANATVPSSADDLINDTGNGAGGDGGATQEATSTLAPADATVTSVTEISEPAAKVCCGDYPYRSWFHDAENRACCEYQDSNLSNQYQATIVVGVQFNVLTQICCDTGPTSSTIC